MTSDPIKELSDLIEWSQTHSEEVLILPRVISSGPRETNERDEKGWFGYFIEAKAKCHSLAKDFWHSLPPPRARSSLVQDAECRPRHHEVHTTSAEEWKARTLRIAKPRRLCRARLVLDMRGPGLRRTAYASKWGNHLPGSGNHTLWLALPTTSTFGPGSAGNSARKRASPSRRSPPVDEPRRLHRAFEFARKRAALEQIDPWCHGEFHFRPPGQVCDDCRSIGLR